MYYICTINQLKLNTMDKLNQLISNDIIAEKLYHTPDKGYIQMCQKIFDNCKDMHHKDFIDTGRIMPRDAFLERYPDKQIPQTTKNICRYVGGFYIEFVGTKKFSWAWHEDKDFDHVESTLFNFVYDL